MTVREAEETVRFGVFQFDPARLRLLKNGSVIALGQQPIQVLSALLERRGEIVSREDLRQRLWGEDVFVDFDHGLNKSVQKLRDALNDSAGTPLYIETIPRLGYRFIAPVESPRQAAQTALEAGPAAELGPAVPNTLRPRGRNVLVLVSLASCVLLAALAWLLLRSRHTPREPIRALAVLPFENLSNDPGQDYFVQGMTDELTTTLARIPNLTVVSRNSAAQTGGARKPVDQLARQLNVDAVIEGSVYRSGRKVRINAQLIDVRDDRNLWAGSFEGTDADALTLQDDVATMVAHAARLAIAPSAASRQKVDPAAQDAYLRGRYFINKQDPGHAIEAFDRAIALEPAYASAYAGLADALDMGSTFAVGAPAELMPRARAAAERAIQLDPENGEAYTALGSVQTIWEWNFAEAERNLLRGIALSPDYSLAEMKYAALLDATGRPSGAVAHMQRALELDPLSFWLTRRFAATLYLARRYDEALAALQAAQEMDSSSASVEYNLALIYQAQGKHDETVAHDLIDHKQWPAADTARLQSIYQRQGWPAYLQARRSVLLSRPVHDCTGYDLAVNDIALGDLDHAFQSMNQAVDQRCYHVVWARVDPLLDPLWSDPRAPRLIKRIYTDRSAVK
jgi:TolB-like protein/DNA-binding winged helix-turn-helix (wHTH) protein